MALLHARTLRIKNHGPDPSGSGVRIEWVVSLELKRGSQTVERGDLDPAARLSAELGGAGGLAIVGWARDEPDAPLQEVSPSRTLDFACADLFGASAQVTLRIELRARNQARVDPFHERIFWRLAPGPDGASALHAETRARLDEGIDSETRTAPRYLMYGSMVGITLCFAIAFVPAEIIWWFSGAELWVALMATFAILGLIGLWHTFWRFVAGPVEERLKKRHPIARVVEALEPTESPERSSARRHLAAFGALTGTRIALTASLYGLLVSALSALVAAVGTHLIALSLNEYIEHSVQMCMQNFIVSHVGSPRVNDSYARSLMQMRRAVATLPEAEKSAQGMIDACAKHAKSDEALRACLTKQDARALGEATAELRTTTKGNPADILTLVGVLDDAHVESVSERLVVVQDLHACVVQLQNDARFGSASRTTGSKLTTPKKGSGGFKPNLLGSGSSTTVTPSTSPGALEVTISDCSILASIAWDAKLGASEEQRVAYDDIDASLDREGALLLNPDELQKHARAHCDPDLREIRKAEAAQVAAELAGRDTSPGSSWVDVALRALALLPFLMLVVIPFFVARAMRRRLDELTASMGLEEWADRVARPNDPDA